MVAQAAPGPLRRLTAAYAWLLSWLLVLSVAILIVPVTLQILSRFTGLIPSYIWTEEMARFLFVWMVMLGANVGLREGIHFVVDVWPRLRPRAAAALRAAVRQLRPPVRLRLPLVGLGVHRVRPLPDLANWPNCRSG